MPVTLIPTLTGSLLLKGSLNAIVQQDHILVEFRLKPREAYSTINSAAKDGVKVLEDVMVAAQAGAKNRVRCRPGRSPVTMAAVSTAQSGNRSCNACAMASDANARHGHAQRNSNGSTASLRPP